MPSCTASDASITIVITGDMHDRTIFPYSIIFYVTTIRKICFTWPKYDIIVAHNKHLVDN